jgi:hypothetical protein
LITTLMCCIHIATFNVENSAHISSCKLKFVHVLNEGSAHTMPDMYQLKFENSAQAAIRSPSIGYHAPIFGPINLRAWDWSDRGECCSATSNAQARYEQAPRQSVAVGLAVS